MKYKLVLRGGPFDGRTEVRDAIGRCAVFMTVDRDGRFHRHEYQYAGWSEGDGFTTLDCEFVRSVPGSTPAERLARTIQYIMADGIPEVP